MSSSPIRSSIQRWPLSIALSPPALSSKTIRRRHNASQAQTKLLCITSAFLMGRVVTHDSASTRGVGRSPTYTMAFCTGHEDFWRGATQRDHRASEMQRLRQGSTAECYGGSCRYVRAVLSLQVRSKRRLQTVVLRFALVGRRVPKERLDRHQVRKTPSDRNHNSMFISFTKTLHSARSAKQRMRIQLPKIHRHRRRRSLLPRSRKAG